jgi:hypothetical protein
VGKKHMDRITYKILVVRPEGKRPFGRTRHRWDDSMKMYLNRVEEYELDSRVLGYNPVVGSYENSNKLSGSIKG